MQFEESIYHATLDEILDVIFSVPEDTESIMLVGHNPSMHEITEYLSNKFINKYPTCCLASLTVNTEWNKVVRGSADMNFLKKPSELR